MPKSNVPSDLLFVNAIGLRFGRLVVQESAGSAKKQGRLWRCLCDCGKEVVACSSSLRRGNKQSCGCLKRDRTRQANTRHGGCRDGRATREYTTWAGMNQRCYDPKTKAYHRYGGRGITVCDRWRNSFEAFLEDMGKKPAGMSIDRIDNNGNYEPGNCRWATQREQTRNQRTNRWVTVNGETRVLVEWCEMVGLKQKLVLLRLHRGWTPEEALGFSPRVKGRV